ncbi:BamA/OMP85 family outer membrane protein [Candidatus Laterigemmans baculatus]|uniref:BamA/OMP85 family outer membrane protein n=1 Tax=Candidatus Laterigemmans baculatus TaxID=2770505 RepID=UPI0013DBD870|nr:POTRA domain-containing protein [Candidatus Laterigemmans baculatus]
MPKPRLIFFWCLLLASPAAAQFGGGAGGAGAGAPAAVEKPRFRDHVMEQGGLSVRREVGDKVVRGVRIVGNRQIGTERIQQLLRTRVDRVFDQQAVLADVRRLYEFRAFRSVQDSVVDDGQGGVTVTFTVEEYPLISQVIFHGNRAMGDRELRGRAGLAKDDPVNDAAIESTRRRLLDYYHGEGFSLATIESVVGLPDDPNAVVYRINEGPKERIAAIHIIGNSIVSEARLKKVIASRGPMFGLGYYIGNAADMEKIDGDVEVLTAYYRNLGYLTAKVDRLIEYDKSGKWLTVTFVIEEGPQFTVNEIRIAGNRFIDESSLRAGLLLTAGEPFNGTRMNTDVNDITYSYGSLGFIYAEVEAEIRWIDSENSVDVVYKIEEGDRWKVGHIYVEIDGEPNLMREYTMLNYLDLVEGQFIDRRMLEMNRRRLLRSELLETNPAVADPPDLRVVPQDEEDFGGAL